VVGILTAAVIAWQSWETRKAAQASRDSVREVKAQTAILSESVDAAKMSADAARDSALTARIEAESLQNAERAWILAHAEWFDVSGRLVTESSGLWTSHIAVKIICKNEGKSPAWIDGIHARLSIVKSRAKLVNYESVACDHFGPIAPIGPGETGEKNLHLESDGVMELGQFFDLFVIIEYHDVFGLRRETTIGYSINEKQLNRQFGVPERNRNT